MIAVLGKIGLEFYLVVYSGEYFGEVFIVATITEKM